MRNVDFLETLQEVNRKGHIDLSKAKLAKLIFPDVDSLPFEFSKDRSIVYLSLKFTKEDLDRYYEKVPQRDRKIIRCVFKKTTIRLYFNNSERLSNYYPQKVKIYRVKREVNGKLQEVLAFEFYDIAKIIKMEEETEVIAAKYLSLKRLIPPLIKESLLRLDGYIITRYYSLQLHHSEEFRDVFDILITFDHRFINSIKQEEYILKDTALEKRIKRLNDSKKNEIRFYLGKKLFKGFMRKHGPTPVKVFFSEDNILITTDRELTLPKNFRPIYMEYIEGYKTGFSTFKKEAEIRGTPLSLNDKREAFRLNNIMTLIKLDPKIHTKFHSEFVKRVYSNFFLLLDEEHLIAHEDPSVDEKLKRPIITVLALYLAFKKFYGEHKAIVEERFFYQFFLAWTAQTSPLFNYFGKVEKLTKYWD